MTISIEHKREQWKLRRKCYLDSLTPEQLKEVYKKSSARRSAVRAEKAISEGRVPGKSGTRVFSAKEKKIANKASYTKYRTNNLDRLRLRNAEIQKQKRAVKAISEGRTVGLIGKERFLTDEQRLENRRDSSNSYWVKNPDKRTELYKKYYESHKSEHVTRVRNRKAKIKGNGGTHTKNDITSLWFLQKGKCTWCLQRLELENAHVDHRVPIKLGGSNDKKNLQLLHAHCNKSKAAKHPIEYGLKYGLLAW